MEPILDPGKEGINVPSGGHLRLKAYATHVVPPRSQFTLKVDGMKESDGMWSIR